MLCPRPPRNPDVDRLTSGFTALALLRLGDYARQMYATSFGRAGCDAWLNDRFTFSLPLHGLVSATAGEVWYAVSVMSALMLFGLAVFLFVFGILPYWFKLHKHLSEILGCWALT